MTTVNRRYYGRGPARDAAGESRPVAQHKYKVGQEVRFVRLQTERLSRELDKSLFAASFEVSRLLPLSGAEFQYRLKNLITGQERIASEAEIFLADGL